MESTERTDIVPESTEPATKLILYYHPSSIGYSLEGLQSITKEENEETLKISEIRKQNPVDSFRYALKSSEATRQYPKRLKMLFLGYKLTSSEKAMNIRKELNRHLPLDDLKKSTSCGLSHLKRFLSIFSCIHSIPL